MSPQKAKSLVTKRPTKSADKAKRLPGRPRKSSPTKPTLVSRLEQVMGIVLTQQSDGSWTIPPEMMSPDAERVARETAEREATPPAPPAPPSAPPAPPRGAEYVARFRKDPELLTPKNAMFRFSGDVNAHVMYVRTEQRFQVDLTDENTLECVTVHVPAIIERKVTPIQRTVAFREAVRVAGWVDRARLSDKGRVLVESLQKKQAVRVGRLEHRPATRADRPVTAPPIAVESKLSAHATSRVQLAQLTLAEAMDALEKAGRALTAAMKDAGVKVD